GAAGAVFAVPVAVDALRKAGAAAQAQAGRDEEDIPRPPHALEYLRVAWRYRPSALVGGSTRSCGSSEAITKASISRLPRRQVTARLARWATYARASAPGRGCCWLAVGTGRCTGLTHQTPART